MAAIGFVFLFIGLLAIVIGLIQLLNIFSMFPSKHVREGIDITEPRHRMMMVRVILTGLALMAIGLVFALVAVGFLLMWAGGA